MKSPRPGMILAQMAQCARGLAPDRWATPLDCGRDPSAWADCAGLRSYAGTAGARGDGLVARCRRELGGLGAVAAAQMWATTTRPKNGSTECSGTSLAAPARESAGEEASPMVRTNSRTSGCRPRRLLGGSRRMSLESSGDVCIRRLWRTRRRGGELRRRRRVSNLHPAREREGKEEDTAADCRRKGEARANRQRRGAPTVKLGALGVVVAVEDDDGRGERRVGSCSLQRCANGKGARCGRGVGQLYSACSRRQDPAERQPRGVRQRAKQWSSSSASQRALLEAKQRRGQAQVARGGS
jgi:hypothetical protein